MVQETSLFGRRRAPVPRWSRAVLVGWLLVIPLTAIGIASARGFGDCFSSCPPPLPEAEATLRGIVMSSAVGTWLALPTLVVAALRWPFVRWIIAALGAIFVAVAFAGAAGIGGSAADWVAPTWPATILVAIGALLPSAAGAVTARSVPSDVAIAAGATFLVLVATVSATGLLFPVAVIALGVAIVRSRRAWPSSR